jgi:uncharacterized membrane protein YoaK (UPF0700 family)
VRSAERDVLLFILAVTAGSADGWSYFGLGHAFVANMTGNTVLLGISIFQNHGDMLHPFISLSCYAAGTVAATVMTRKVTPGIVWSKSVSWTLLLEALIMAGAEAGWMMVHRGIHPPNLNLLLGAVAFGIGLQSGAMLRLKVPGVVTTYITGTWTTLLSGLALFGTNVHRETPGQKREYEERLLMQAGIIAVYFLSAVLTGWLFRHSPPAVGLVTASSVLLVGIYGALRSRCAEN